MKKMYQIALSILVALVLATTLSLVGLSQTPAVYADSGPTFSGPAYCPTSATPPCQQWWDVVEYAVGPAYGDPACISLVGIDPELTGDNPFGQSTQYIVDYGWSYTDANEVKYEQSYIGGSGGALGPYILVGSFSYYECN